jgi:hypothetical protein
VITQDLEAVDLDAKWTPKRRVGRYGLHVDSTIWLSPRARGCAHFQKTEETKKNLPTMMKPCERQSRDGDVAGL